MATDVTSETLQELLAHGAETDNPDNKSSRDPSNKGEVLELAKDVAAMESLPDGGYLICLIKVKRESGQAAGP